MPSVDHSSLPIAVPRVAVSSEVSASESLISSCWLQLPPLLAFGILAAVFASQSVRREHRAQSTSPAAKPPGIVLDSPPIQFAASSVELSEDTRLERFSWFRRGPLLAIIRLPEFEFDSRLQPNAEGSLNIEVVLVSRRHDPAHACESWEALSLKMIAHGATTTVIDIPPQTLRQLPTLVRDLRHAQPNSRRPMIEIDRRQRHTIGFQPLDFNVAKRAEELEVV